jgi:hypothetical protein
MNCPVPIPGRMQTQVFVKTLLDQMLPESNEEFPRIRRATCQLQNQRNHRHFTKALDTSTEKAILMVQNQPRSSQG